MFLLFQPQVLKNFEEDGSITEAMRAFKKPKWILCIILRPFPPKVATVESGRMFWIHQKQIDVGKMRVSRGFSREERRISSPSGSTNSMRDTESYRVVGSPACGSKCWYLRGRSQTTFTRRGRQGVQKCPLFVNVYTIENVNAVGQVVKKETKSCQRSL